MNDDQLKQLLRAALPPAGNEPLSRDLWNDFQRRLPARRERFSWTDWALLAAAAAGLLIAPEAALILLCHL